MTNLEYAAKRLNKIRNRIQAAEQASGRVIGSVKLIGASKRQTPELIEPFYRCGLRSIGENYLQEALNKRAALADLNLEWHFIGQIQSNKTKSIAENFSWVHGVDRLKIAQRIAKQNPNRQPIQLLLQVNVDAEDSKGGVSIEQAGALSNQITELEGINLRGFMLIPEARKRESEQRKVFANAYELLAQTNQRYGLSMDSLSMGMSGDFEAAIAEGSTMVRIGTDLFGARN